MCSRKCWFFFEGWNFVEVCTKLKDEAEKRREASFILFVPVPSELAVCFETINIFPRQLLPF